jgi:acyl-coenzyme A thioesterase PaaI-like protein
VSAPHLPRFPFAEVTTLTESGPGEFRADVNDEWTIGGKPNGGYLLAMLGRAAVSVSRHQHVIAASAQYLRSPNPGPVSVHAEVLRTGRSASQARVQLGQDGRPCVEALVTTSKLAGTTGPYWDGGTPAVSGVSFEDCTRLVPRTIDGRRVAIMDQIEVRLEPQTIGFTTGQPSGRGELRGWLSLIFAVDAFPPATFDIEFTGWVPTLELTAYIRALPAPGPVRVLQRAQTIDARRVDESCFVWDHTGRLVAQGTQLAGIPLG